MHFLHANADMARHLAGTYDLAVVALSIAVAVLACSGAFDIADRIRAARRLSEERIWLAAGAVVIGSGVWAMHFTAMLAFSLPVPVNYDLLTTLLSVAPAQFSGGVVLYMLNRQKLQNMQLIIGGILMGAGIGAMHHIGLRAMRMTAFMHHDHVLSAVSVAAAVLLAIAALYVESNGRDKTSRLHFHSSRIISALVMGLAIASMHYTAMMAVSFHPNGAPDAELTGLGAHEMAVWVGFVVLGVIALSRIARIFGRQQEATRLLEQEVTKNEETGQALKASKARFKDIAEISGDWFWEMDETLHFTYHSSRYFEITGFRPEDKIGTTRTRYVGPADLDRDADKWAAHKNDLKARRPFRNFEYAFKARNGATISARISGTPVFDDEGNFQGYRGTGTDISEHKLAEEALLESEARFRAVLDNTPLCLNLKDTEGRFLFANKRYEEWWGCSAKDVVGKKAGELPADPFRVEPLMAAEKAVLETGVAYETEISGKRPQDGQVCDRMLIKFPVKSPDGSIIGLGTVAVDITERKRTEEELIHHRDHLQELVDLATQEQNAKAEELKEALVREQELNELQSQFVSMASHEFRTPLAIIDSTAQRLKRKVNNDNLTPEDTVQRIDNIRSAVQRMTRLMEDTLSAARMQDGKLRVEIEPSDIGNVVKAACMRQQEVAHAHVISCEVAELPATIQADSGAVEQILTNLLSNAVKYAPDAPYIAVKAWTEGPQVVISVRDHGLGIDEEELDRIGERFFRAETSTGIAGTGIGLNLVKTLVEMHGGSFKVESRKNEGSTFTIYLPVAGPDRTKQVDIKTA